MNSKILLLTIAVVSVGLFAMPSTLSLFAGQHTFDKRGDTTICLKCHSDIGDELAKSVYHNTLWSNSTSATQGCIGCHTADTVNATTIKIGNQTLNYTVSRNVGLNIPAGLFMASNGTNISVGSVHAAVTVECAWCHTGVTLTNDAHAIFASNASQVNLRGANGACIGCHTKAQVNITWTRRVGYNITFDVNSSALTFAVAPGTSTTNTKNY